MSPYEEYLKNEIAKLERLIDMCYAKYLQRENASEHMTAKVESMIDRNELKLAELRFELENIQH